MVDEKTYNLADEVYFMFNNIPVKGVITHKCLQRTKYIEVEDIISFNSIKNRSNIEDIIINEQNWLYRVSVFPKDNDNSIILKPIDGWFNGDYLYRTMNELFVALMEMAE